MTTGTEMENILSKRNNVTKAIRTALRQRSGKTWSVRGGNGTAYGWITIRRYADRSMTDTERAELAALLGLDRPCHFQGESIPASHDYYREYIARANGETPTTLGKQYWD